MAKFSAAELGLPDAVACPFCERSDTELHSAFGSQLSVATYWCRRCGTAFDHFRGALPEASAGHHAGAESALPPAAPPVAGPAAGKK